MWYIFNNTNPPKRQSFRGGAISSNNALYDDFVDIYNKNNQQDKLHNTMQSNQQNTMQSNQQNTMQSNQQNTMQSNQQNTMQSNQQNNLSNFNYVFMRDTTQSKQKQLQNTQTIQNTQNTQNTQTIQQPILQVPSRTQQIPTLTLNINNQHQRFGGIFGRINNNIMMDINNFEIDDLFEPVRETLETFAIMTFQPQQPVKKYLSIDEIKNTTNNKVAAAELYKNNRITFTKDIQNVHDTGVSKNLKIIYDTISKENITHHNVLNDIAIYSKSYNPNKSSKALEVATYMYNNNSSMITSINASEHDVIVKAWNRATNDKQNSNIIKENIIDALNDCFEDDKMVCSSGRVSRVLQALTYVDKELTVDNLKNTETYKNEIFTRVHKMIIDTVNEVKASKDSNERLFGESYENPSIKVDQETEARMKNKLYDNISSIVDSYKNKISSNVDLDRIKNEAYMAID
jgi:hypothetical protein